MSPEKGATSTVSSTAFCACASLACATPSARSSESIFSFEIAPGSSLKMFWLRVRSAWALRRLARSLSSSAS